MEFTPSSDATNEGELVRTTGSYDLKSSRLPAMFEWIKGATIDEPEFASEPCIRSGGGLMRMEEPSPAVAEGLRALS